MKSNAASRNAGLDGIEDVMDAGTPPAIIEFFTGAAPALTTDADTGTKLATLTFANPAAPAASGGVLTFSAITADTSADNSGTPGHWRIKQGGTGTVLHQGTAAVGSGEISLSATIAQNGNVSMSSLTFTAGNA